LVAAEQNPCSGDLLKLKLYAPIKLRKLRHIRYVLDDLLNAHEDAVLLVPPYHSDLIAIENVVQSHIMVQTVECHIQVNLCMAPM
jgi:hypothetical protein